jgi:signal transduction histidine kinase/CheY-like chemotaxis protein
MKEKSFLSPLRGKVIAAFILACLAIGLAMITTYLSFDSLLVKVDELSVPNHKLKALNSLFEQITRLDQEQRADAIKNPNKPYRAFLQESKKLSTTIDSLSIMPWENNEQTERLLTMKRILAKRDYLLLDYLKLKSELISNKSFSNQLDSLSEILVQHKSSADSSVTTSQTKTTTTTYLPEEKKRNFLGRLFGGKKKDSVNRVSITQEINTQVDTLAVAKQDSAIVEIGRIMKKLDDDQQVQTKEMLGRELNLINTNITLINQLLSILQEVEAEEMALIENKNTEAASVVSSSISRIGIITIVFFLLAALLVFLIMVDISRSNYYRLQLIKSKNEAEQLGQVKQRFLTNMRHEIRTPLQSIIGFSEQLKASQKPDIVNAIQQSSEHLLHIVDEVLDYSRIESGQFTLSQESFCLEDLLHEIASVIQVQADQKKLEYIIHICDSSTRVLGDSFRLRQILYNLLSNAIKFTKAGSVRFTGKMLQETESNITFQFQVSDTGKGVPKEDQERIFKQFEQGAGNINRHYGGSGLGLSIVKKLVDLQRGTIEVKSEIDVGSEFTVTLTFQKDLAPIRAKGIPVSIPNSFAGPVWVIDDDPLILKLCSLILENNRVVHRTFQDPSAVLTEDVKNAQVIFLDIRMPTINGVELCKQLKARASHLVVVALTAHVLPQESASIMQSGFDRILTKPFREQDFLESLGIQSIKTEETKQANEIDLSYLKKMTLGDQGLLNSIISEFVSETSKNLMDLEKRLLDQDAMGTREIIHQLAGRVGQFGARYLSNELKTIEQKLHLGKKTTEISELNFVIQQLQAFKKEMSENLIATKSL